MVNILLILLACTCYGSERPGTPCPSPSSHRTGVIRVFTQKDLRKATRDQDSPTSPLTPLTVPYTPLMPSQTPDDSPKNEWDRDSVRDWGHGIRSCGSSQYDTQTVVSVEISQATTYMSDDDEKSISGDDSDSDKSIDIDTHYQDLGIIDRILRALKIRK